MAEYRIVAKLDPAGVSTGSAKVKQELAGVDTAAAATKAAINKAFDQQAFDRSIGALIAKLDAVENGLGAVVTTSTAVAASNRTVTESLDKVAASAGKAATNTSNLGDQSKKAGASQAQLDAAMRRVLQATDAEAAELAKLNALLADAKRLLDAGKISTEQYAAVQKLAADAALGHNTNINQQRQGVLILGEQFRQFSTEVTTGISPVQAFAQQAGQAAFGLQFMGGQAGKVGAFLASGWGTAVIVASTVLLGFLGDIIKTNSALDDAVDKLKKDGQERETNRQAQERYKVSAEGVAQAIRDQTAALKDAAKEDQSAAERANIEAKNNLAREIGIRNVTKALLEQAIAQESLDKTLANRPGEKGDLGALALANSSGRVAGFQKQLDDQNAAITAAERNVQGTRVDLAIEQAKTQVTAVGRVTKEYDDQLKTLRATALAQAAAGKTIDSNLTRQIIALEKRKQAAVDAAQAQDKLNKSGAVVTAFQSPVAGGRITTQFGQSESGRGEVGSHIHQGVDYAVPVGTAVRAPASGTVDVAGQRQGYGNAIYINFGGGTSARFGHLSKFNVKPGDVVNAGDVIGYTGGAAGAAGSGDSTGPHLHYEVRQNGRAVNPLTGQFRTDPGSAADDAQRRADAAQKKADEAAKAAQRKAEQEADFVTGVQDTASTRGLGDKSNTLQGQIARTLAEFKKRFDREANQGEKGKITDALTQADARETAQRFDTAYVEPLKRLQALQGKTGLDRDVLNKQLEESTRLGRDLTPVKAQQIDNSIRQSDALQREAQILADVRKPLQDYQDQIKALNELLKSDAIDQTTYNARVGELGGTARNLVKDMPGVDPKKGQEYSTIGAKDEENSRYDQELEDLRNNRAQILAMGVNYDGLEEAAAKKHAQNLRKIDDGVRQSRVESAQSISESLLSIAENSVGKQSGIYKALFVASKAFAIADASIKGGQALAQALSLPFPANLGAIATVAASVATIVQDVQAISLNLAGGGYVSGAGTPTSDSIPANLSDGEFVVNAAGTARNRAMLEAINSGSTIRATRQAANNNAAIAATNNARPRVSVQQHPGVAVETHENLTTGDVEIIAQQQLEKHGDRVVATALTRPNSRSRKALQRNTTAKGLKT